MCSGSHNFNARKMKLMSMYGADHEEHFEKKVFEDRSILVNNMCIFVFLTFLPLHHRSPNFKTKIIPFLESSHLAEQNKGYFRMSIFHFLLPFFQNVVRNLPETPCAEKMSKIKTF